MNSDLLEYAVALPPAAVDEHDRAHVRNGAWGDHCLTDATTDVAWGSPAEGAAA